MLVVVFFFNVTATTEIYTYIHTLSLHDALPIFGLPRGAASNQGHPSFPFVLSLSKHRPSLAALETRAALRQAQGERAFSPVALEGEKGEALKILLDRKSTRLNSSH